MGCMQKVFATEIDVEIFREAERTRAGFGTVRLAGLPLARCAFEVERARETRTSAASTSASSTGPTPGATASAPSTCATSAFESFASGVSGGRSRA
jgi:hypothetical protein